MLIPAQSAFAEGSVDVYSGAGPALRQKLSVGTEINAPYDHGYTMLRVYAQAGETIDMGSSAMGLGGSSDIVVYPPGTSFASETEVGRRATYPSSPVFGTDVFDCDTDAPGTGRIASRAEELAGPLPNAGGYTPCEYTAPADGIYAVMMAPYIVGGNSGGGTSTLANPDVSINQSQTISIWDVTVRDAAGVIQPGRVFTDLLHWKTNSVAGAATNLTTYVYTPAGQLYRVELFNPQGLTSDLAANGSGVVDATTGEPIDASFQWGTGGTSGYPATLEPTHGEAVAPQLWAVKPNRTPATRSSSTRPIRSPSAVPAASAKPAATRRRRWRQKAASRRHSRSKARLSTTSSPPWPGVPA